MRVAEGVSFFVAHGFEELVDPDGGVDCEALFVQGFDLDGAGAGVDDVPEAGDTHISEDRKVRAIEDKMKCWCRQKWKDAAGEVGRRSADVVMPVARSRAHASRSSICIFLRNVL